MTRKGWEIKGEGERKRPVARISTGDRLAGRVDGAPRRVRLDVLGNRDASASGRGVSGTRARSGWGCQRSTARPREIAKPPHPLVHRVVRVDYRPCDGTEGTIAQPETTVHKSEK